MCWGAGSISTNRMRVYGASGSTLGTFTGAFPTQQWLRCELLATAESGTADVSCAYYLGNSAAPAEAPIAVGNATTAASGAFSSARFGKLTTTGLDAYWMDTIAADTAPGGSFIGGTVLDLAGVVDSTGWTLLGGGDALSNVTDSNPATGVVSGTNPVGQTIRYRLPSILDPGSADFTVPCEGYRGGGGTTGSVTGYIYDGATLRATSNTITPAATNQPFVLTFPAADHADIDTQAWASGALELALVVSAS